MKILLVDDTVEIRELIAGRLSKLGEVTQAGSGNEARDLLKQGKSFDLIVSDFQMPNGNGDLVLVTKNEVCPNTHFLFFSSDLDLQLSPGVNAIFSKTDIPDLFKYITYFSERGWK